MNRTKQNSVGVSRRPASSTTCFLQTRKRDAYPVRSFFIFIGACHCCIIVPGVYERAMCLYVCIHILQHKISRASALLLLQATGLLSGVMPVFNATIAGHDYRRKARRTVLKFSACTCYYVPKYSERFDSTLVHKGYL